MRFSLTFVGALVASALLALALLRRPDDRRQEDAQPTPLAVPAP